MSTTISRRCRIGFLNPWREGAEIQAFMSLAMAAQRIGCELVRVRNSQEIIAAAPDFVLAIEPGQPKTTDVPTFGVVHSPRSILLESKSHLEDISYLQSLLTYDGWLTIADSLRHFIEALSAGAGRTPHVGFYYNTPQRQGLICGLEQLAAQDLLRLCYFGINWEPRARPLFRALAQRPYMRIYGPPQGWDYLTGGSYCGEVPFDGQSVQRVYALFGIGLVVLSTQHMLDDVVSNRVFEIASVGAAAICPQIPWIGKNFGDSVFYYDPFAAPADTVARIDDLVGEIRRDPKAAAQQALAARAIFDEKFAGEVMLGNAVRYFAEWRERAGRTRDPADGPLIDVVIRAVRSPIGNVYRALRSIDGQTAGRFRVILVCCNGLDASGLTGARWNRIDSFETVTLAAADPGMALALGLKAVDSELFAVLEEDDFWLSGHIASLLALAETSPPGRAYAYSGVLRIEEPPPGDNAPTDNAAGERRRVASLEPLGGDIEQIAGALVPGSFLASSALLRFVDLDNLAAGNAAAVVLQAHLLIRTEPAFSQRATLCVTGQEKGSAEAGLDSLLRLHALADRLERQLPSPAAPVWSHLQQAMQRVEAQRLSLSGKQGVLALEGGTSHEQASVFAVVSWGCAATHWLARALNSHPDIFCVHAGNFSLHQYGQAPYLDGPEYLKTISAMGWSYAAAGDVHGVDLQAVSAARRAFGNRFSCAIVVREPIARLHSQIALFKANVHTRAWNIDYVQQFIDRGVVLPVDSYENRLVLHGISMLNSIVSEQATAKVWRCEDLTTKAEALAEFVSEIVGRSVRVDPGWARAAVRVPAVIQHAKRGQTVQDRRPQNWQIEAIRKIVLPEAWDLYSQLGYVAPDFL